MPTNSRVFREWRENLLAYPRRVQPMQKFRSPVSSRREKIHSTWRLGAIRKSSIHRPEVWCFYGTCPLQCRSSWLEDKHSGKAASRARLTKFRDKFRDPAAKHAAARARRRQTQPGATPKSWTSTFVKPESEKEGRREERRWALLQEAAANKSAVKELRDTVATIKQRMIDLVRSTILVRRGGWIVRNRSY